MLVWRSFSALLSVALVLAGTSVALAQGTIEGTVSVGVPGFAAVVGAEVRVADTQFSAVTDQNGHYSISGLDAGSYILEASEDGLDPVTLGPVTVVSGSTTTQNIAIAGAMIDAAVTAGGVNLSGAVVRILGDEYRSSTGSGGSCTLVVRPGTYILEARCRGYAPVQKLLTVVSGQVIDVRADLTARLWDVQWDFSSTSNPNSPWTYGFIFAGDYSAYTACAALADASDYWLWSAGGQGRNSTGSIERSLYTSGQTVHGAVRAECGMVLAHSANSNYSPAIRWISPVDGYVRIKATFSGQYSADTGTQARVSVLRDGESLWTQQIRGFVGSDANNNCDAFGSSNISVLDTIESVSAGSALDFVVSDQGALAEDGDVGLAVTITPSGPPPGVISGTVRTNLSGNVPVAGATVRVVGTSWSAVTGSDGAYTIIGVDPGTYEVQAAVDELGSVSVSPVSVRTGQSTNCDLIVPAARAAGKVTAGGTAASGATVSVVGGALSTTTAQDGSYSLLLKPGSRTLSAQVAGYRSVSGSLTLTSGQTSVLNLALTERVQGKKTVLTTALPGGYVEAFAQDGTYVGHFTSGKTLTEAYVMAFGPDGNLYVCDYGTSKIEKFSGSTGAYIGPFASADRPVVCAWGPDANLYAGGANGKVQKFNGATGALMGDVWTTGFTVFSLCFAPNGDLCVPSDGNTKVVRLAAPGYTTQVWKTSGGSQQAQRGMHLGSDGNLYVSDCSRNAVDVYNGSTGAWIRLAAYDPSNQPLGANDFCWLDSGHMLVNAYTSNKMMEYGSIGSSVPNFVRNFASNAPLGLGMPLYMCVTPEIAWGVTGNLDVTVTLSDFSGDLSLTPVRVDLVQGGVVAQSTTITLNQRNNTAFTNIPPGDYVVRAKANVWLSRSASVRITGGDTVAIGLVLPNGDTDGSGTIEQADFTQIDSEFGGTAR